jgi:hypothetical protein
MVKNYTEYDNCSKSEDVDKLLPGKPEYFVIDFSTRDYKVFYSLEELKEEILSNIKEYNALRENNLLLRIRGTAEVDYNMDITVEILLDEGF